MIRKIIGIVLVAVLTSYGFDFVFDKYKELKNDNVLLANEVRVQQDVIDDYLNEIQALTEEIVLRQDVTSVIIDASRSYNLDPVLLAIVIKSESNFRPNPKHTLPNIVGPGGINVKAHTKLKNNPNSYVGNIYASAEVLGKYVEDSDSLTLAIARYKGLSPLGLQQAKSVLKEYEKRLSRE